MGEIGIQRREFLYELQYWEIVLITRGYRRRYRDLWSVMRWQTYNIMSAIPYCDLKKAGVYKQSDLLAFPWEKENRSGPTEEEKDEIRRDIARFNARAKGGQ